MLTSAPEKTRVLKLYIIQTEGGEVRKIMKSKNGTWYDLAQIYRPHIVFKSSLIEAAVKLLYLSSICM